MKRSKKELLKKIHGGQTCQIVSCTARLRLADQIGKGATLEQLSERVAIAPPLLHRLMRALLALRLVECEAGFYTLTEEGEHLKETSDDSLRAIAAFKGSEMIYRALGAMEQGLIEGCSPFEVAHGKPLFEHLEATPNDAKLFHDAMQCYEQQSSQVLIEEYPFAPLQTLLDIGGGTGSFLQSIMKRHSIRGTVFDLPHLKELVVSEIPFIGGSFFDGVPKGFGGYLLRSILHDWSDEKCVQILRGIPKEGKLLLFESVIEEGANLGTFADLSMFVMSPGGKERTLPELKALLTAGGWQVEKVWQSTSSKSLIECQPLACS